MERGAENMIGGYLINVIFLPVFKVTPAGVCKLTFYTQSEIRLGKDKLA